MKRTAVFSKLLLIMSLLTPGSPAYGQTFQLLRSDLQVLIDSAATEGMRMSVGIISLHEGAGNEPLLLGSPDTFAPASTIKLLLIAALMQQVDAGRLNLQSTVTVDMDDIVGGMGRLQTEPAPQPVTLERLAELTVTISDNTATNVLVDAVGYEPMARLAQELGLESTQFGRKMFEAAQPPMKDNTITAGDALVLLAQIYRGDFLSDASRQQIIDWMSAQTVKTKFGAAIPADVPLAHKTGENGPVSHDIGYLLLPGKELAMVVFSESSTTTDFEQAQAQLNPWVARAAGLIYQAVN